MLESATNYVPPLGFLWLIRAWQNAWDVGAQTQTFSIECASFNWPTELEVDDIRELNLYLDVSREYQLMTFEEARARALLPPHPTHPPPEVDPEWDPDSPDDTGHHSPPPQLH